jgi:hypothetical protein
LGRGIFNFGPDFAQIHSHKEITMAVRVFGLFVLLVALLNSACGARKIPVSEIQTPKDVVEATTAGVVSNDSQYLHQIASDDAVAYLTNKDNQSAFLRQLNDLELDNSSYSFSRWFGDGVQVEQVSSNNSDADVINAYSVTLHKACNVSPGNPVQGAAPDFKPCGPAFYKLDVVCTQSPPPSSPVVRALKAPCQLQGITKL